MKEYIIVTLQSHATRKIYRVQSAKRGTKLNAAITVFLGHDEWAFHDEYSTQIYTV